MQRTTVVFYDVFFHCCCGIRAMRCSLNPMVTLKLLLLITIHLWCVSLIYHCEENKFFSVKREKQINPNSMKMRMKSINYAITHLFLFFFSIFFYRKLPKCKGCFLFKIGEKKCLYCSITIILSFLMA